MDSILVHNTYLNFVGASQTTTNRINKLLKTSTDTTTGTGVKNFTQEASRSRIADYKWLTANRRTLKDTPNLKISQMPDGTKYIYRNSTTGSKTIEIQKANGKKVAEIRYAE